jgi:outer membrane protein assembly factor BamA
MLIWGDSVTKKPFIVVSASMRKKYDITNSFHLSAVYTPRQAGGTLGYNRFFGRKKDLNSRIFYAGPLLSLYYYTDQNIDGELQIQSSAQHPDSAILGTIGGILGCDNREYQFDPRSGGAFWVKLGYSAGESDEQKIIQSVNGSLRAMKIFSPAPGHNFALYGGFEGVAGTLPVSKLVSLSNRQMLRGFDLDETYGKLGIYTGLEYRFNIFGTTSVSMPLKTLIDRVQGVLFAAAGTVSQMDSYKGMFRTDRIFAETGLGLRLHLLIFGVVQYLIAVDFAVPVYPLKREYQIIYSDGSEENFTREPFRFVFGITQIY